jgi:adenylate kinase family enzyme
MNMSTLQDGRANGVDLPEWWLEKVRELVDERNESMVQLGKALADVVGRHEPWSHSIVSRFLRNRNTTIDMAEAFVALLGIPRPFFVARSMDEALSYEQVSRRYGAPRLNPEQQRRLATVDQVVEAAQEEADDQTRKVSSKDERAPRSGRSGRAARGRSPAS